MPIPGPRRTAPASSRGVVAAALVLLIGCVGPLLAADGLGPVPFGTPLIQPGPGPRPPGGPWVWPGSQINPGSEEPAALFGPAYIPPRPELRRDYWVVETRGCPQVMGADPWPCLRALQFD